jgi:hypothetical protein
LPCGYLGHIDADVGFARKITDKPPAGRGTCGEIEGIALNVAAAVENGLIRNHCPPFGELGEDILQNSHLPGAGIIKGCAPTRLHSP